MILSETPKKYGISFRPKGKIFDSDKISQSTRSIEMTNMLFCRNPIVWIGRFFVRKIRKLICTKKRGHHS